MKTFLYPTQLIVFVFASLSMAGCAHLNKSPPLAPQNSTSSKLDTFIEDKMKELSIHGVSLAIIKGGETSAIKSYGYANIDLGEKIKPKSIFEAASLSKSIFAHFVMTFVDNKQLDLDKPLYLYLPHPDLKDDMWHRNITARMVLSHRSGLPNWRENEPNQKLNIKFEPGSDFEYSGEGYQYLALVLRHIEKTDWDGLNQVFQKRVAQPLGIKYMHFVQTPYTRENRAEPYDKKGRWIDWANHYWYKKDDGVFVAASSVHTDIESFAHWMIAVMGSRLISAESYQQLFSTHSDISSDEESLYYGLGFAISDSSSGRLLFHSGHNDGFTSWYLLNIEEQWGYVILTNSESGVELGEALLDHVELITD